MDLQLLLKLGLTKNDLGVYEALVMLGISKTGAIVRESKIASSRVYASLNKLQQQGLVSSFVKNNVRYYRPEPPEQLLEDAREQTVQLELLTKHIEDIVDNSSAPARVAVYDGTRAYRQAFLQHLRTLKPKGELHVIGYGAIYRTEAETRKFFKQVDELMVGKGAKAKMIIDGSLKSIMKIDRRHRQAYELRALPSRYFSSMAINIAEHEVMLSIIGDHPIVVCLRDAQAIQAYQKQFQLLWSIGKELT